MLTDSEMRKIAEERLSKIEQESKITLICLEEWVTKKDYGNIYRYTSKKYYETKDDRYAVAGNSPFLVENETGRVVVFGTALADEFYIQAYDNGDYD